MKKILLSITLVSLFFSISQGQNNRDEKIKAVKIATFTDVLNLTSQEAEKFWPMYNAYEREQKVIKKKRPRMAQVMQQSDAEIEEAIDQYLAMEQELLDLKKAYYKKFMTVLPTIKVAKIQRAENEFRKKVVRAINNGRNN